MSYKSKSIRLLLRLRRIAMTIALIIIAFPSFASEKPIWVTADGEAYLSEIDTPKEVMERAKRDAGIENRDSNRLY